MLLGNELTLEYTDGGETVQAVDGVTLEIRPGEFVGILGASGSGKSSLLYLLSGLKRPTRGEVLFEEQPLGELDNAGLARLRRARFGFVFQRHFLISYLTGRENVETGGEGDAAALLETLGVAHCAGKRPHQMSGGERQRVAIARAVVHAPSVVFADEPTASLDRDNAQRVMGCLREVTAGGTLVVVTHDPEMLDGAHRTYHMKAGRLLPD